MKSRRKSDFCNTRFFRPEQFTGLLDPGQALELCGRHAGGPPEQATQVKFAQTDPRGRIADGKAGVRIFPELLAGVQNNLSVRAAFTVKVRAAPFAGPKTGGGGLVQCSEKTDILPQWVF